MRTPIVLLLLAFISITNAAAPAPSGGGSVAADWERFGRSPEPESGYVESLDDGLRKLLWPAAHGGRPLADTVADLAKQYGIDRRAASDLVEATLVTRSFPEHYSDKGRDPRDVDRASSTLWRAVQREPAAPIVLQQAGWILSELDRDATQEARYIDELGRMTNPAPLAARIAWLGVFPDETRASGLAIALKSRPTSPALLLAAAGLTEEDPCMSAEWARQALEAGTASGNSDATFRGVTRNSLIAALIRAGLQQDAIDVVEAAPPGEIDSALGVDSDRKHGTLSGLDYEVPMARLRAAMASAAFLADRPELSKRLLAAEMSPKTADPGRPERGPDLVALVRSAIERMSQQLPRDAFDILDPIVCMQDSWDEQFLPTVLLFERLARESNYPVVAGDVLRLAFRRRDSEHAVGPLTRNGKRALDCRARSTLALDPIKARSSEGESPTAIHDPASVTIARSLAAPLLHPFTERALPGNVAPWEPTPDERKRLEKDLSKWKFAELWPIRAEQNGKNVILIGLSQDYDQAGEVSGGGYWVARSHDGGTSWDPARYTGLRPMQPYVIKSFSHLPLDAGDHLHIEVEIRELDTTKIIFPPIGRAFKQTRSGLYLDVAWADLDKDSDGDGLTDLAEERLMTDPHAVDTDGDGLPDAKDPLPQIPRESQSSTEAQVLVAALRSVGNNSLRAILPGDPGGQDDAKNDETMSLDSLRTDAVALSSEATMFVVADRRAFAGVTADQRIVVLSPSEFALAGDRFGVQYPGHIQLYVDHSGTQGIVIWNESWRGMTIRLKKVDGIWTTEVVNQWIT